MLRCNGNIETQITESPAMKASDRVAPLILEAEREAQMISAIARLGITAVAIVIFLIAGGAGLPVAPVVLTYLLSYGAVSVISAVCSLRRFFNPQLSLVFTAVDGISLALLIGFALKASNTPFAFHAAVPGFVFVFCILILATMRYTVGPVIVAFSSFALTWFGFTWMVPPTAPETTSDAAFFFGPVQNSARWGFLGLAFALSIVAVIRRRRTLVAALTAAQKTANLSRYLPDRIAGLVAEQGIDALRSGRTQHAAVVFVDIRGFTSISEQLEPDALGRMLSDFRANVAQEVEAHSGFVEKFIGDAVMAVFGVAESSEDCDARAVRCAVAISRCIAEAHSMRDISVTIGVHSGKVFAGAIGTEQRLEFTILGDAVNIAARLQEAAKTTDSGIVVSAEVLDRAELPKSELQTWAPIAATRIRGRQGEVRSFARIKSNEKPI